ncbi:hypothetical protein TNCV_3671311 [Trichonephila clavipes]|nr:hypothetical protein TNCV_3671311 [Trichonephila clavipes]
MNIIRNTYLTVQRFSDDIERSHDVPNAEIIADLFLLMQNNARPYTAILVEKLSKAETTQRISEKYARLKVSSTPLRQSKSQHSFGHSPRLARRTPDDYYYP